MTKTMKIARPDGRSPRRGLLRMIAGGAFAATLPGCASPVRGPAVPRDQALKASMLGLPNERFFPVMGSEQLEAEFIAAGQRQMAQLGVKSLADLKLDLLAVSGGGEDGAFGSGLLCGWTAHGTRPTFDLVTGVSTGSLTAPFAYLGPSYDPQLRYVYTGITAADVMTERAVTAALFDDALTDNAPLFKTISRVLDDRMLADIARAYDSGRLLLIGTTNIDAQQPVIWNIGAIAKSGHPKAADTIRRILLASAAVPGAFPPTLFDVTSDGKSYQEMHVDGGAFVQSFLYPSTLTVSRRQRMAARQPVASATAYVIRNGRLDPDWADVRREMLGIAARAISTMIVASGYNDTLRIYYTTQRDHVGYNLAYIGSDFTKKLPAPFDHGYMQALFDYGYERGRNGYHWANKPPMVG